MKADSDHVINLFSEAKDKTAEERARFLDAACGEDLDLRRQLERLLRMEEPARGFLSQRAAVAQSAPVTEKPGDLIDRYKLLSLIGEGGCGAVYLAEQQEPVRRR